MGVGDPYTVRKGDSLLFHYSEKVDCPLFYSLRPFTVVALLPNTIVSADWASRCYSGGAIRCVQQYSSALDLNSLFAQKPQGLRVDLMFMCQDTS